MGMYTGTEAEMAALLRSHRTTTQADVDRVTARHDAARRIPAATRYVSCQGHHAASPAAH